MIAAANATQYYTETNIDSRLPGIDTWKGSEAGSQYGLEFGSPTMTRFFDDFIFRPFWLPSDAFYALLSGSLCFATWNEDDDYDGDDDFELMKISDKSLKNFDLGFSDLPPL